MSSAAYCRTTAYEAFRRELPRINTPVGLCRAATAIGLHEDATTGPEVLDEVIAGCQELARAVKSRVTSNTDTAQLAHLHDVLFDVAEFRGETEDYYRPANSYLAQVLQTKRGIPISLVLIYRTVAAELGLKVEGVNAPGHFLAAVHCKDATGDRVLYVDPFYSGKLLNKEEAIERIAAATGRPVLGPKADALMIASSTDWLRRMLLNLQATFASRQQERNFLAMQELEALLPAS